MYIPAYEAFFVTNKHTWAEVCAFSTGGWIPTTKPSNSCLRPLSTALQLCDVDFAISSTPVTVNLVHSTLMELGEQN